MLEAPALSLSTRPEKYDISGSAVAIDRAARERAHSRADQCTGGAVAPPRDAVAEKTAGDRAEDGAARAVVMAAIATPVTTPVIVAVTLIETGARRIAAKLARVITAFRIPPAIASAMMTVAIALAVIALRGGRGGGRG